MCGLLLILYIVSVFCSYFLVRRFLLINPKDIGFVALMMVLTPIVNTALCLFKFVDYLWNTYPKLFEWNFYNFFFAIKTKKDDDNKNQ
jgi:hypothetical protein